MSAFDLVADGSGSRLLSCNLTPNPISRAANPCRNRIMAIRANISELSAGRDALHELENVIRLSAQSSCLRSSTHLNSP
jgi:hypothetical protein